MPRKTTKKRLKTIGIVPGVDKFVPPNYNLEEYMGELVQVQMKTEEFIIKFLQNEHFASMLNFYYRSQDEDMKSFLDIEYSGPKYFLAFDDFFTNRRKQKKIFMICVDHFELVPKHCNYLEKTVSRKKKRKHAHNNCEFITLKSLEYLMRKHNLKLSQLSTLWFCQILRAIFPRFRIAPIGCEKNLEIQNGRRRRPNSTLSKVELCSSGELL